MQNWQKCFSADPLPALLAADEPAIRYFAGRDLLGEENLPVETLWELPGARRLLRRQLANGSWKYPNPRKDRAAEDYGQIETFRNLGFLIENYGFNRSHPTVQNAAAYFFSKQTPDGDLRGIYGSQYTPNYTGAILELLIKAGYYSEEPILRGLDWLLKMRQNDGGWTVPLRTHPGTLYIILVNQPALDPVRAKPSSHLATGCVLRAFAAHPDYQNNPDVIKAGRWLSSRLFKRDSYIDRQAPEYWLHFSFPFWFTDLLCALDSLSRLGFPADDPDIKRGLDWFVSQQRSDGTWQLRIMKNKDPSLPLWIQLNICRVFRRFLGD